MFEELLVQIVNYIFQIINYIFPYIFPYYRYMYACYIYTSNYYTHNLYRFIYTCYIIIKYKPILYTNNDENILHNNIFYTKDNIYMYIFDNIDFNNTFESINKYKNYIIFDYGINCKKRLSLPTNINEKLIFHSANGNLQELKKILKLKK